MKAGKWERQCLGHLFWIFLMQRLNPRFLHGLFVVGHIDPPISKLWIWFFLVGDVDHTVFLVSLEERTEL